MPPRGRGQQGMRGRGRGRGGSRSANASGDEGGNQSGGGRSTNTTQPRGNRGASQAPRGAVRGLRQALQQAGTPSRSRGQTQRGRGNASRPNSPRSNSSRPNSPHPNGFSPAPPGIPTGPSRNNTATREQRYSQLKQEREREREDAIAKGYIVDPDRPRALAEAVTPIGTCQDMCPEYERLNRINRRDYFLQELDPSTVGLDRSQHRVDENRMVKAFKRSAAGTDEQLPSDLRPPHVLLRTCQYLFKTLLSEKGQSLETAYGFIWDRSRAIRNDFSIQQLDKVSEIRVAIECLEWIARFHILTLHQIGGLPKKKRPERYDYFQDLEQLDKTLLSLLAHYHNVRKHYRSPNEAEFRAYRIIYQITSPTPNVEDTVQLWPAHVIRDPRVQRALKLYNAAQTIRQEQGPLQRRIGHPIAQANWDRFFKLVKSKQTSFLMSCVAEIYFNFIRHKAIRAIWRAYRTGGEGRVSDGWSLAELGKALGYDSEAQIRAFIDNYGFKVVKKDDGKLYLDVNSVGRVFPAPLEDKQEPQLSKKIVESKRYHRTASALINGLSVNAALEAGLMTHAVKIKVKNSHGNGPALLSVKGGATARANSLPRSTQSPSNAVTFSGISSLNQNKEAVSVRAEATQPTFTFSPQPPHPTDPREGTSRRGGDSLFVTGDSDDEEGVGKTRQAKPAPAPMSSSDNPFAKVFASSSDSTMPSSQSAPISNASSAPLTSNLFRTTQASAPSIQPSSSTSPSSIFKQAQPAPTSNLFPAPDSTSNIFTGAQTTVSTTKPFSFGFSTGAPSIASPSNIFTPSSAATTTTGNMPSVPSSSPFTFPSTTPTIADKKPSAPTNNMFASSTPASAIGEIARAPASNDVIRATTVTETTPHKSEKQARTSGFPKEFVLELYATLAEKAAQSDSGLSIKERTQQEVYERYKQDPDMASRLIARIENHILPTRLAEVYAEDLEKVSRLEAEYLQMKEGEAKQQLMKTLRDARGARFFREEVIRKQYLAVAKQEEKAVRKEREAEREQSYEHFKGIRTEEVMQYVTRQVALVPREFPQYRESVFGAVPKIAEAMAAEIFRELLIEKEKQREQRELERKKAEEARRNDRGKRFRERVKAAHQLANERRKAEKEKREAEEAQREVERQADLEKLLNVGKNYIAGIETQFELPPQQFSLTAPAPGKTSASPSVDDDGFKFAFGSPATRTYSSVSPTAQNDSSNRRLTVSELYKLKSAKPNAFVRGYAGLHPIQLQQPSHTQPATTNTTPATPSVTTPQPGDKRKRQEDEADQEANKKLKLPPAIEATSRTPWQSNYFQRKAAGLLDWQLKRKRTKEDYYYPYITLPAGTVHTYSQGELRRREERRREESEERERKRRETTENSASALSSPIGQTSASPFRAPTSARPGSAGSLQASASARPGTSSSQQSSTSSLRSALSRYEESVEAMDRLSADMDESAAFYASLRKRIEAGDEDLARILRGESPMSNSTSPEAPHFPSKTRPAATKTPKTTPTSQYRKSAARPAPAQNAFANSYETMDAERRERWRREDEEMQKEIDEIRERMERRLKELGDNEKDA